MFEVSSVRCHVVRSRRPTIFLVALTAVARGLAWLVAAIGQELRIRRDMRQLAAMDDHMLKDIGLCRCEIDYRVRYGKDE